MTFALRQVKKENTSESIYRAINLVVPGRIDFIVR